MKTQYVPLLPYYDDKERSIATPITINYCLSLFHIKQIRLLLTEMGLEDCPTVWKRISQQPDPFNNATNFVIDSGQPTERTLLSTMLTVRDVPRNGTITLMYCVAIRQSILPEIPVVNVNEAIAAGLAVGL